MTPVPDGRDARVRLSVYRRLVDAGRAPTRAEVAAEEGASIREIDASLRRLAAGRALVLQPASGEVLMAEPFSAVPTSFLVESDGGRWFANCIWDAMGIPAMLGRDARIRTSCDDCGEAMDLSVEAGELRSGRGVVHYLVPARRWWENVVFT